MPPQHNLTLKYTTKMESAAREKDPARQFSAFKDALDGGDPLLGQVVGGRFGLIGRLGSGGTADVYLAMDGRTGKEVALKLAAGGAERELAKMNSFIGDESSALSRFDSPAIVKSIASGEWMGRSYLALELLEGQSLDRMMESGEPLPWDFSAKVLVKVCDALAEVHGKGLVHRDIKPANVFITPDGDVRLIDFGLAAEEGRVEDAGLVIGTPSYLAPESIFESKCDRRMDIYALGVMAYEMLTGIRPFTGTSVMDILFMHRDLEAERPSEANPLLGIPAEIESLIMKALEKHPEDRFQSAREMRESLEALPRWGTTVRFGADSLAPTVPMDHVPAYPSFVGN